MKGSAVVGCALITKAVGSLYFLPSVVACVESDKSCW